MCLDSTTRNSSSGEESQRISQSLLDVPYSKVCRRLAVAMGKKRSKLMMREHV